MKTHHYMGEGHGPSCRRTPKSVANMTTDWTDVTCKWCLQKTPVQVTDRAEAFAEAALNDFNKARSEMGSLRGVGLASATKSFISTMTTVRWSKAPEGSKCPGCGGETLERSRTLMGGPWSGSIRCTACPYHDTVASYLGKTMITVEPLSSDDDTR